MTSRAKPARRAVLLADPRAGYRLTRSRGWASETAALDAVRLVDTNVASAAVRDLAGFFALGSQDFAVVRGGIAHASDGTHRSWREVVALGARDLERIRCNPFRILPPVPSAIDDLAKAQLDPPELPGIIQPAEDLGRLVALRDELAKGLVGSAAFADRDRETLLAALIEAEHTLVVWPAVSYHEIELLLLLLPAPLRLELTFHSHALSPPAAPVPRFVFAPPAAASAFEGDGGPWTHRLPEAHVSIGSRARRIAGELLALLETPERLVEADVVYERYAERLLPGPRLLMDELETALRFGRMRGCRDTADVVGALRIIGKSLAAHDDAAHPEPRWAFELLRKAFHPAEIGEVVAASFPDGAVAVSAYAIEQFAQQRRTRTEEFEAFARPIQESAASMLLVRDEDLNRRLRTLLVFFAAGRRDVPALVSALRVPLDAALVDRLGGVHAWAPGEDLAADTLRALLDMDSAAGVAAAIEMLGRLAPEVPAGRDRLRLIELGLDFARLGLRRLAFEDWQHALPLANAAIQLCQAITFSDRVSLDGRPDSQHYHELLSRAMNPTAPFDIARCSDADVFFGFLGADAARSRLARREVDGRGDVLVRAIDERIRRFTADEALVSHGGEATTAATASAPAHADVPTAEAAHWGLALLDRVRRSELDPHYVGLGIQLLERWHAQPWLMAYVEAQPDIAPALLAHTRPRDYLEPLQLTALCTAALAATLDEARAKRDVGDVAAFCRQLQSTRVLLRAADVRRSLDQRLRALVDALRLNSLRPVEMDLSTLHRALTPILAPDALALVRTMLRVRPEPAEPAGGSSGEADARGGWLSRVVRRGEVDRGAPPRPSRPPAPPAPRRHAPRPDAIIEPAALKTAAATRRRPKRRRDRTAGIALGLAILTMAAVLLSSDAGRRALFSTNVRRGGGPSSAPASEVALTARPVLPPTTRLARARASAGEGDWSEVVELLSGGARDRASPDAFAWDSLLASAALRRAEQLSRGDAGRRRLLEAARDRAGDALDAEPSTQTAAELMRLIRAEACLSGDLVCENANVLVDLALAVESADLEIAGRADSLIRSRW